MSNLFDYLTWRGDLTLENDGFGEVDALILSSLSYVNFDGIVPGPGKGCITISEASEAFFGMHPPEELKADRSLIRFAPELLKSLAKTERFGSAVLSSYVSRTDLSIELQFAAVKITTSDGIDFISFRGTDDTIIGWKEDFNLSYKTVPAENEAVEYLQTVGAENLKRLRLGGHSKGGHLAVYAASGVSSDIAVRIDTIYNCDGPGFNRETFGSEQYKSLNSRIVRIIPESSIIGRLLECDVTPVITKSSETGIMQHDPTSWQISGKDFVTVPENDHLSNLFDMTMTGWLEKMPFSERKFFIDDLFAVFDASGCVYLSLLTKVGIKGKKAMLDRLNLMSADSADKVKLLVRIFFENWNEMRPVREIIAQKELPKIFRLGKAEGTS
jgi:hypothetical protein